MQSVKLKTMADIATASEKAQEVGYTEDAAILSSDEDRDEHEEEEEHEEEFKGWDEGGKSDCGYRDTWHDTLMAIGASIHKFVGEPNEKLQLAMKSVGNWFQEASYAARDFKRGEMNMKEGLQDVDEEEDDEEDDEEHADTEDEMEKLETVAEESSKAGED